jgi:hypothetical protein
VVQSLINKNDVAYIPAGATTLRALDAVRNNAVASAAARAPAGDSPFALLADFHSVGHVRGSGHSDDLGWFSLIVGGCSDSLLGT